MNPLLALYRGTEYFSLARTFRTAWGDFTLRKFVDSKLPITRDTNKVTLARTFKMVWVSTLLTDVF